MVLISQPLQQESVRMVCRTAQTRFPPRGRDTWQKSLQRSVVTTRGLMRLLVKSGWCSNSRLLQNRCAQAVRMQPQMI